MEGYKEPDKGQAKLEQGSFLLMLVLVTVLFILLLRPFFSAVFWACVIGLLFHPLHQRFLKLWGNPPQPGGLDNPGGLPGHRHRPRALHPWLLFQEGTALYQRLQSGEIDPGKYLERLREAFPATQLFLERMNLEFSDFQKQLSGAAISASRFIAQNAVQLGQGTLKFFINLGLMLYIAFFLLRDGTALVALLLRALPLRDDREHMLFAKFAEVTRATVKGNLVVAVVQGTLGGIIFWFLGLPAQYQKNILILIPTPPERLLSYHGHHESQQGFRYYHLLQRFDIRSCGFHRSLLSTGDHQAPAQYDRIEAFSQALLLNE